MQHETEQTYCQLIQYKPKISWENEPKVEGLASLYNHSNNDDWTDMDDSQYEDHMVESDGKSSGDKTDTAICNDVACDSAPNCKNNDSTMPVNGDVEVTFKDTGNCLNGGGDSPTPCTNHVAIKNDNNGNSANSMGSQNSQDNEPSNDTQSTLTSVTNYNQPYLNIDDKITCRGCGCTMRRLLFGENLCGLSKKCQSTFIEKFSKKFSKSTHLNGLSGYPDLDGQYADVD